jgi:hypothetical protein
MNEKITNLSESSNEGRLGLEDAQMEANMMRVKLKEVVGHEPTKEDYDKALQMVEELKKSAANESDAERAFIKMVQVGDRFFGEAAEILIRAITFGAKPDGGTSQARMHVLDNYQQRFEKLKSDAEEMAKDNG